MELRFFRSAPLSLRFSGSRTDRPMEIKRVHRHWNWMYYTGDNRFWRSLNDKQWWYVTEIHRHFTVCSSIHSIAHSIHSLACSLARSVRWSRDAFLYSAHQNTTGSKGKRKKVVVNFRKKSSFRRFRNIFCRCSGSRTVRDAVRWWPSWQISFAHTVLLRTFDCIGVLSRENRSCILVAMQRNGTDRCDPIDGVAWNRPDHGTCGCEACRNYKDNCNTRH